MADQSPEHKQYAGALDDIDAVAAGLHEATEYLQELFDETDWSDLTITQWAYALVRSKDLNDKLDAYRKRVFHVMDQINKSVLPGQMEKHDQDSVRLPGLGKSLSVQTKTSATMVDKAAGFAWLRERGLDDLITETVNAGTLSSTLRQLALEQGIEPPDDAIKVSTFNAMSIRSYKPK